MSQTKKTSRGTLFLAGLLVCASVLACFPAMAQVQFAHFDQDDGLPQNTVESLCRDSYGFLWVGTYNGISRYDGSSFENYSEADGRSGLPGNTIFKIFEDGQRNLWVGTNRGLALFDRGKNRFSRVASLDACIADIDGGASGQLWVSTQRGLFLLDASERRVLGSFGTGDGFPSTLLTSCVIDKSGTLWISTGDVGFFSFTIEDKVTRLYQRDGDGSNSISSNRVRSLSFDADGKQLWVGTSDEGVNVLDVSTGAITSYKSNPSDQSSLGSNLVSCVYTDSRGRVWVGCQNGFLNRFDPLARRFTRYKAEPFNDRFLQSNTINAISEDADGNLWLGTHESGIYCLNRQQNMFQVYSRVPGQDGGLRSQNVRGIVQCGGRIIVGSDGGGLQVLDTRSGTFRDFDKAAFCGTHILDVSTSGHELWCSTWGEGVYRVNVNTGQTVNYLHREGSAAGLSVNNIRTVSVLGNKAWIGTSGDGLQVLDIGAGTFVSHQQVTGGVAGFGLPRWITRVLEDTRGRVWVASLDGVLLIKDNGFTTFRNDTGNSKSLRDNIVYSVFEDSRHQIWLLTNKGVDKFIEPFHTFEHLSPRDGFPPTPVAMLEDSLHCLWISSFDGLYCYDQAAKTIRRFSRKDGIIGGEFNVNAALRSSDGTMYFGGQKGLLRFNPRDLAGAVQSPSIVFRNLFVGNIRQDPAASQHLSRAMELCDTLTLGYSQSLVAIEVADLNNILSGSATFSYCIEGFSNTWVPLDESRKIVLSNLPPGTYLVRVNASYGSNASSEASLTLVISPRWWQTAWFKAAIVILAFLLLSLAYRIKVAVMRSQNTLLKAAVEEKTRDLTAALGELKQQNTVLAQGEFLLQVKNDQLQASNATKDKLFSIVAHDLKTPITGLVGLASILRKTLAAKAGDKGKDLADQVLQATRNLQQQVEMLLNWSRSQAGSLACQPVNFSIESLVRDNVTLFYDSAWNKEIHLQMVLTHTCDAIADPGMMTIVFRNLLSNAIKFTPRGGQVMIKTSTPSPGDTTVIQVIDSGIGMSQEQIVMAYTAPVNESSFDTENQKGTGLGLVICRDFLAVNHARMEISSPPGQGTTVSIILPRGEKRKVTSEQYTPALLSGGEALPALQGGNDENLLLLIVEDNNDIRQYLAEMFEPYYAVDTACNGDEGFDKALQQVPDLVITDLSMPGKNGLDLCRQIQAEPLLCHVPIIILSAHAEVDVQVQGLKAGAYDFVAKPFNKMVLYLKVQSLLESRKKYKGFLKKQFIQQPSAVFSQSSEDKFMLSMHQVLDANYRDPEFSVEKFAAGIGYSRSQLFRKMKASLDTTPVEYLKLFRLTKAKELIDTGNWRVAEIAYEVGFSDPVYFGTCFKNHFGSSPNHFIKNKN